MTQTFSVDPASLRRAAAALTVADLELPALQATALQATAPLATGPATAAALADVVEAMRQWLRDTNGRIDDLAAGLHTAADRYGEVDHRAAVRLSRRGG
jgi:hypothetical protein